MDRDPWIAAYMLRFSGISRSLPPTFENLSKIQFGNPQFAQNKQFGNLQAQKSTFFGRKGGIDDEILTFFDRKGGIDDENLLFFRLGIHKKPLFDLGINTGGNGGSPLSMYGQIPPHIVDFDDFLRNTLILTHSFKSRHFS